MPLKNKAVVVAAGSVLIVWGSVWGVAEAPLDHARGDHDAVSIIFGGDIMLDRNVAAWHEANPSAVFARVAPLFAAADIRVANLEGTITTNPSIARRDSSILRFTFEPTFAKAALGPVRLDAVSLANNHALDFGADGYRSTRSYLSEWGIAAFGHPYDRPDYISTGLSAKGQSICLVGYHSLYDPDTTSAMAEVVRLRESCTRVVVFAHWGEEYQPVPESQTVATAHSFVDAGADLVIGAHPHVVQPYETYRGRAIFYSLGNFVFDQRFSPEVQKGLLVQATFGGAEACYRPIPIAIEQGVPVPGEALDEWCLPW